MIVPDELPYQMIKGRPEVIGNLANPNRVVDKQFGGIRIKDYCGSSSYLKNVPFLFTLAEFLNVTFKAPQTVTCAPDLGMHSF